MVSIRTATVDDAPAVAHVHVQSWLTTYAGIVPDEYLATLNEADRALQWREWLTKDVEVYLAELGGEVVGFISGGPIREPIQAYDAELYAIYLLQPAQGRGIGRSLLGELSGSLLRKGLAGMIVWVLEKNPSKHFYEKSNAQLVASKDIQIGGLTLSEVAYGWPSLAAIQLPQ